MAEYCGLTNALKQATYKQQIPLGFGNATVLQTTLSEFLRDRLHASTVHTNEDVQLLCLHQLIVRSTEIRVPASSRYDRISDCRGYWIRAVVAWDRYDWIVILNLADYRHPT